MLSAKVVAPDDGVTSDPHGFIDICAPQGGRAEVEIIILHPIDHKTVWICSMKSALHRFFIEDVFQSWRSTGSANRSHLHSLLSHDYVTTKDRSQIFLKRNYLTQIKREMA